MPADLIYKSKGRCNMNEIEISRQMFADQRAEEEKAQEIYSAIFGCRSLGKMLKSWRILNGLTQKQLAKKLKTKRQHVQKWEYDICKPKLARLKELSLILAKSDVSAKVIRQFYV